jgi:CO/xanthine dehydrogenase Mo-binding subunit/aerobic-type carbon monoxide dehydrogenase small subunit (CoxS/CutS family)
VDEFVTTTKHAARTWIESGVDADGRFTFRRARIVWDAGAYAHSSPAVMRAGMLAVCGPYRVPAAEVQSVMAYTNAPPAGSFRGLGANQAAWAGERQVDVIARELGLDPVELRRRNVVRSGDRLPTGERVGSAHWAACLEAVAASLASRPETAAGSHHRSGTGVALAMKHTMTPSRSEAIVAALADGTVEVRSSLVDMGQGLPGVLAQAAADSLGLAPERIRVIAPDTARTPFDATTSSSRGTWSGTTAVQRAAEALRGQLEAIAADRSLTVDELLADPGVPELVGHGVAINEPPIDPETGAPASSSHWHQGAVAVRVTVDPETGVTRVVEAHGAAWAGRVVNTRGARLQNEGNILTGLGPTLFESLAFTTGDSSPRDLLDYRIPSILDMPDRLDTTALEAGPGDTARDDGEPTGLGESLIPAVAPAVAAAVAVAVDVELTDLPLDPTRVLAAIRDDPTMARVRDGGGRPWGSPDPAAASPERTTIRLTVDGTPVSVDVDPLTPLATVLSESLGRRSVRQPCGVGACGACTAVVDGRAVRTCLRPVGLVQDATILTAEGLADDDHVRGAFVEAGAAQCGFCIPGMVLAARTALERIPDLDDAGIRRALAGNLCRCGTYARILAAVGAAAGRPDPG